MIKIALIGDVGFFGKNSFTCNPNVLANYTEIKEKLSQYDIVIGNLETPLTDAIKVCGGKSAYIKGCPQDVDILKYLGISYVTLANNHIFDYRLDGFRDTINILERANIGWYGANEKSIYIDTVGEKVALHGYCCYSTNARGMMVAGKNEGINILDPNQICEVLHDDRINGYLSIVSCHWGQEHIHYPNTDHIKIARYLSRQNNVIIHGHHPHVIQGIDYINNAIIAYSLGNFCFDDVYTSKSKKPLVKMSDDNRQSCILSVDIEGNIIKGYSLDYYIDCNGIIGIDNNPQRKIEFGEWCDYLKNNDSNYNEKRERLIKDYIQNRAKNRDFQWYVKRMNMDSAKILIYSKINKIKYNKIMKEFDYFE